MGDTEALDKIHQAGVSEPDYLGALNAEQRLAVETLEGPLLVLAGAGTGKTRVLTTRLAHILNSGRAYPSQILAVTFTNKAAQEMKERVSSIIGGHSVEGWWLGTFHSLAARMLRRHAERAGLSSNFTILDPDDQVRLIKPLMEERGVDTKKWPPKVVMSFIERWKDRALGPTQIEANEVREIADGKLPELYADYQRRLKEVNACDFGDLLLHVIMILRDPVHAEILQDYHRRFRYILVDEYQDTNVAQYLWLRLLAQGTGNICCVGDDDQSIYGWRGAEVGNILRFERDFPGAKIVRLEQNYRSSNTILNAAGAVIANNAGRLGKSLWSERGEGEKITVCGLWDSEAEARWVGEQIEQLQRPRGGEPGESLGQIAVLVRTGFQTREFEERFIKLGLPYRVVGGPRFYERMEIRDALAYFRVTVQEADDLALERIINTPKRGLGNATVQRLYQHGRKHGICLSAAIRDLTQTDELKPKIKATLGKLMDDFERWRSLISSASHTELAAQILDESGYMDMWKQDKTPEAPGRIENLRELIGGMQEYESMAEFLEHVSLVLESREAGSDEGVTIMTLHGAKGLEFDTVFLSGWEEGLFPSQRTMDENGMKGLEEERRLAYVGITRARKRVFVSHASNRRMYGNWVSAIPSRFVDELPRDSVDIVSETGTYKMAGRSPHWDSSGIKPVSTFSGPLSSKGVLSSEGTLFVRGDRVFHEKFGYGRVVHIDGHKLDILFDKGGQKRVMDSFLEKIGN
ncbi:MAG: UvrD-helicase domain-containing protein [Alphaproteobacteria bacterium]|nr:UvrD-helicase domain-containing protein [Alphaproteobacteria bacterium]MCB9975364.1 UvrD-helicase domain-containing protein [Rhodospirillales bacterium]